MLEELENLKDKGIYVSVAICIIFIFMSGLFFGVIYYLMETTHNALLAHDCSIDNNTLVSSCQDLFNLAIYPFLALRELLVWASFFFIFGLVIALLLIGYRSGSSPITLGIMVIFTGGMTYFSILLSNAYRTLIEQETFRLMMVDFTVYNNIMINFPWFTFFISIFAVLLGIINFQKTSVNTPEGELDY